MFNKPETFKSAFRLWKYSYVVLLIAFLIFYILFRPSDKAWTDHVFFCLKIVGLITVSTLLIFLLSFIFMKVSRFSAKLLFVIFPLPLLVLTGYSIYFFFINTNSNISKGLECSPISDCNTLKTYGVIALAILIPLNLVALIYFLRTYWQRSNHQSYYRRIWYYFVVILLLLILAAVGYAVYYYNLQTNK